MTEPIEMLFVMWTWVGPRNHVLDGGPDPPWEGDTFEGERAAHCKVWGLLSMCGGDVAFCQITLTTSLNIVILL